MFNLIFPSFNDVTCFLAGLKSSLLSIISYVSTCTLHSTCSVIKSPLNLYFETDTNSEVCHCKTGFTALWLSSGSSISIFSLFFAGVFLQSIRTQNSTLKIHLLSKNTSILTRNTINEVLIGILLLIFPGMLLSISCNAALGSCVLLAVMMLIVCFPRWYPSCFTD